MKKKLLGFLVCASVLFGIISYGSCQNDTITTGPFTFKIENGQAELTACENTTDSVIIPETCNGNPVTSIGEYAFYMNEAKEIQIPSTVTKLGECAFFRCYNLEELMIPDEVTQLPTGVFTGCRKLKELTIPEKISYMDTGIFADCDNLENIFVSENNAVYQDVDGVVYTKDRTVLFCYPMGNTEESYRIPQSVIKIAEYAMYGAQLKDCPIPDTVKEIGFAAFYKWPAAPIDTVNS